MLSDRIKERRIALNMTQEELGEKVGLGRSAICRYENGSITNPKRSMIAKLAHALECDPVWLMDLELEVGPDPERPAVLKLMKAVEMLSDNDTGLLIAMAEKMGGKV